MVRSPVIVPPARGSFAARSVVKLAILDCAIAAAELISALTIESSVIEAEFTLPAPTVSSVQQSNWFHHI
jgi:hypothetical protein